MSTQAPDLSLSLYATGVVRPCEGQEECFAGVGSCGVFREMLINSMTPIRYSKIVFQGTSTAATSTVAIPAQTRIAFNESVGDVSTAANSGYTGSALTHAETNYETFENPVPENSNMLFCVVGMAISAERTFTAADGAFGTHIYLTWLTAFPDIRETIREDVLDNTSLFWNIGNNKCIYQIGLAKHWGAAAEPKGGDKISSSVYASPLDYVCFNAVLCIDNLRNNRRATLTLSLDRAISAISTTAPITDDTGVRVPLETQLYGFIVMFQGAQAFQGPGAVPAPVTFSPSK